MRKFVATVFELRVRNNRSLLLPDSVNRDVSRLINLGKRHIHQDELAN